MKEFFFTVSPLKLNTIEESPSFCKESISMCRVKKMEFQCLKIIFTRVINRWDGLNYVK